MKTVLHLLVIWHGDEDETRRLLFERDLSRVVYRMGWGDHHLVLGLVDDGPVENLTPPASLGADITAVDHH